jgi:hypothetical protein
MPTNSKTLVKPQVHVECPAGQDLLRLRFDVDQPHYIQVTLRFMPSGWTWKEEMGLVSPGAEASEVELAGMPAGSFVLMASFYDADQPPYAGQATVVAAHGVRAALGKMPYICS